MWNFIKNKTLEGNVVTDKIDCFICRHTADISLTQLYQTYANNRTRKIISDDSLKVYDETVDWLRGFVVAQRANPNCEGMCQCVQCREFTPKIPEAPVPMCCGEEPDEVAEYSCEKCAPLKNGVITEAIRFNNFSSLSGTEEISIFNEVSNRIEITTVGEIETMSRNYSRSYEAVLPKEKKCPECNILVSKTGHCSTVICTCGKIFCWYCDIKIEAGEEYVHMHDVHTPLDSCELIPCAYLGGNDIIYKTMLYVPISRIRRGINGPPTFIQPLGLWHRAFSRCSLIEASVGAMICCMSCIIVFVTFAALGIWPG